jgi:hypothetical protein
MTPEQKQEVEELLLSLIRRAAGGEFIYRNVELQQAEIAVLPAVVEQLRSLDY